METRSEVTREVLAETRFRSTAMRPLREALSDESYAGLLGVTDSETIFTGMLDLLRGDPQYLAGAAERTIRHVSGVMRRTRGPGDPEPGSCGRRADAFTRYSTAGPGNSLYFAEGRDAFPDGVVVASERLDGGAKWRVVPDRHLLAVEKGGAALRRL